MSKRVIFISLLLCLIGLWSLWDMITGLLMGRIVIETSVLFLPAGCGLLMGYRYARTLASIAFGFFYLGLLLVFGFAAAALPPLVGLPGVPPHLGPSVIYVAGLFFLAVALLIHWQLYTRPFDEHLSA